MTKYILLNPIFVEVYFLKVTDYVRYKANKKEIKNNNCNLCYSH